MLLATDSTLDQIDCYRVVEAAKAACAFLLFTSIPFIILALKVL
jgi:hypothetical protein